LQGIYLCHKGIDVMVIRQPERITAMMKRALLVLVFLWGGSFLAHGECGAGQSLSVLRTTCACAGVQIFLNVCMRQFGGSGCDPAGQQEICGGDCNYTSATGCISGGPKILTGSLVHRLELPFNKTGKAAYLTCSNDGQAFERWLKETSSVRRAKAL